MASPRCAVVRTTAFLGLVATTACGLRSDPLFIQDTDPVVLDDDDGSGGSDITDPDREGACAAPFVIPVENTVIRGTLPDHGSLYEGTCGGSNGPEDVYTFIPTYDTDVTIQFSGSTEFSPTVRVDTGGCGDAGTGLVCQRDVDATHFFARTGNTYYVTVDKQDPGEGGDYEFTVGLLQPPLDLCPVHMEQMQQAPGAAFLWGNELSGGLGEVDGYCSAPGRENMFQLNAYYPGNVYVRVEGTGGFSPVANLRTGCGATTELICASDGDTGFAGVAELTWFVDPGTYYVVVDQTTSSGGTYELRVDFQ
jgi:hypothetical protein